MPLITLPVLVAGYLLGSIPSGYLAGRWLAGLDIRREGSGSTGATNVLRVVGKGPALGVFLVDVLKGTAAVLLAKTVGLGMLLGLTWPVGLACFGIFLAVLSVSRIVSLSSVVAALALPLLMLGWFANTGLGLRWPYLALALLTTVLVVWRHRSNIQRLLAGTEPRLGAPKG
jgi:glycerol-3-phosphate acyltransferase PlsY